MRGRGPVGEDWEREKERSRMRERERPQKRKAVKHIAAEQSSRDGRQAWPGTADGSPRPCRTPAPVPRSVRSWWRGTGVATDVCVRLDWGQWKGREGEKHQVHTSVRAQAWPPSCS